MSFSTEEYLNLVTSEHREKPKFAAMIQLDVGVPVRVQDLLAAMIPLFDVDLAVGQQLDVIGQWAGISRNIPVPIPAEGVYFEWDSLSVAKGWDVALWADPTQPTEIVTLPDDVYRNFVKAKIAANKWDGSLEDMYAVWDSVFTDITIFVQDNQNMSYNLGFVGRPVDSLTLALIQIGYLPLKPEGVRVNVIYSPIDDSPMFAWDVETDVFKGWDEGSWARILE